MVLTEVNAALAKMFGGNAASIEQGAAGNAGGAGEGFAGAGVALGPLGEEEEEGAEVGGGRRIDYYYDSGLEKHNFGFQA